MIRVACPHCQRTFRTTTEGMGKTAVCSGCGQSFRIGSARPPFSWKPTSLAEDSWVGVEPPAEKKEVKHCLICDAPLEEGAFRCLACGANQVTGLVHKSRPRAAADAKAPFWSILPIKPLIVLAVVAAVGAGLFYGVRSMFSSVADSGIEMARHKLMLEAARQLASGSSPKEFTERFAGRVDDSNLPRFVEMLEAGDASIRKAAAPLIACGHITQVEPIVAKARSENPQVAADAIGVLQAIGPRRLVDLSVQTDVKLRRPAAEALCRMFRIPPDEQNLTNLSELVPASKRIEQINELCRPWPRAVGTFAVRIADQVAPIPARISQVGRTFYLEIGTGTFVSDSDAERTFTIPVEQWCAATGVAVDPAEVGKWISGTLTLASPFGTGWEGEIRVQATRKLSSPPPGFLPGVESLERNESVTLPVVLGS